MSTVGELLLQVGEAHEAELKRATRELEEVGEALDPIIIRDTSSVRPLGPTDCELEG